MDLKPGAWQTLILSSLLCHRRSTLLMPSCPAPWPVGRLILQSCIILNPAASSKHASPFISCHPRCAATEDLKSVMEFLSRETARNTVSRPLVVFGGGSHTTAVPTSSQLLRELGAAETNRPFGPRPVFLHKRQCQAHCLCCWQHHYLLYLAFIEQLRNSIDGFLISFGNSWMHTPVELFSTGGGGERCKAITARPQ